MAGRWTAPGGWVVETTVEHDRQIYRVTRWGGWAVFYPQDPEALEDLLGRSGVQLADLTEQ